MTKKHPLIEYIEQKMKESEGPPPVVPGPVITISREYGCPGFSIANALTARFGSFLDNKGAVRDWKAVNREILMEAAQEINISPETIKHIIKQKPGGLFLDFFKTFSDHYTPSDLDIKKTVAGIVRQMAMDGFCVIVGRAGVVLARDIEKSLHVRIHAPLDYRVSLVAGRENLTLDEARKKILRIDREREYIRNYYSGETPDRDWFDVSFNSEYISEKTIVDSILLLAEAKGLTK